LFLLWWKYHDITTSGDIKCCLSLSWAVENAVIRFAKL
jgi:hypothetical protein